MQQKDTISGSFYIYCQINNSLLRNKYILHIQMKTPDCIIICDKDDPSYIYVGCV